MRKKVSTLIVSVMVFASNYFVCAGSSASEDKIIIPRTGVENEKSEADSANSSKESLKNSSFVLETDEQSANDSLNRISGNVDLGFSAPENSYESEEHAGAGPFEKEKAEMRKQSNQSY